MIKFNLEIKIYWCTFLFFIIFSFIGLQDAQAKAGESFTAKLSCYSACLPNEKNCDEDMEGGNRTAYCGGTKYRPRDHTMRKCIDGETDIVVIAIQQKHSEWAGHEMQISNVPAKCHYYACDSYAESEDAYGTKFDISTEPESRDFCDYHGASVQVTDLGKIAPLVASKKSRKKEKSLDTSPIGTSEQKELVENKKNPARTPASYRAPIKVLPKETN